MPVLRERGIDDLDEKFHFKYAENYSFEDFADWCIRESMEIRTGSTEWQLQLDNSDNEEVQIEKCNAEVRDAAGFDNKTKRGEQATVNKIAIKFLEWDKDQNGIITEDELIQVFSILDPKMPQEHVKQLLLAADTNKDGSVDYREFTTWLLGSLKG